jgi:hypothetical protein
VFLLAILQQKKGSKCYSPILKKFFVPCDVTFYEEQSYYPNNPSQGENSSVKIHWDPIVPYPIIQYILSSSSSKNPTLSQSLKTLKMSQIQLLSMNLKMLQILFLLI